MKKYKCMIVDDEMASHVVLKNYISYMNNLELVAQKFNIIEAINFLHESPVDLVFLDINMPHFTGFDLFKILSKPPAVIITTAYSEYAITAFDVGAVDYLLKPIEFQRFSKAVDRFLHTYRQVSDIPILANDDTVKTISVKVNSGMEEIVVDDIVYIKSMGNYVKLITDKTSYLCTTTTTDLEKKLPSEKFMRVHKSFIVAIKRIEKFTDGKIYLEDAEIPVGITYLRKLDSMFGK